MLRRVRLKPVAIATVAAVLTSCATPPPANKPQRYVAPTSGPTAKLVMRGGVEAGEVFGVYVLDDSESCKGPRLVGAGVPGRNPATTTITANQIATVEFVLLKANKTYCSVRWSFTPVAGKSYLFGGLSQANGCLARVMDMSDPENLKPEPTALRRNPGTERCVSLSQAKAANPPGADKSRTGGDAVLRPGASDDELKGLIAQ